jgi:hypothetical protein
MSGITDTWLQKEWKAIREIDADEAQSEFCRAAAWVGRDPFDISPLESETLIEAAHSLPDEVAEDVLRASRFDQLAEVSRWIQKELAAVGSSYAIDPRLCALRTPAPSSSSANPWAIGYELAAQVRAAIPELATLPVQLENVFDGHLPVVTVPSPPDTIDGLVIFDGGLVCRTAKRRSVSQRFLAARTVFDFLSLHQDKSLLTAARTTKQSEGRAFAAELLAPADELRARLKSPWSTYEELSDVAEELQVSEWVVVHQVQNHRIAKIADMMT